MIIRDEKNPSQSPALVTFNANDYPITARLSDEVERVSIERDGTVTVFAGTHFIEPIGGGEKVARPRFVSLSDDNVMVTSPIHSRLQRTYWLVDLIIEAADRQAIPVEVCAS